MGYTAAQAAKLAGCTVSQLRYWSRSQLVTPTAEGGGYSFRDLVALRVVRSLLDACHEAREAFLINEKGLVRLVALLMGLPTPGTA